MDPLIRDWLEIGGGGLLVFSLPIIIAFYREHPQRWRIVLLTVGLGITIIGWLVALIWALQAQPSDRRESLDGRGAGR